MTALNAPANNPGDTLILVDREDRETGYLSKEECHRGNGILHRAFSVFLFNGAGQVLLQQRSADKPLWPLYWSNTCCSHPRRGESVEAAARRRLREELALCSELSFLYKFEYQASYQDIGAEHELCWVYAGLAQGKPAANATEIADWRYVSPAVLTAELAAEPARFTPWLRLEWAEISRCFLPQILSRLAAQSAGRQPE